MGKGQASPLLITQKITGLAKQLDKNIRIPATRQVTIIMIAAILIITLRKKMDFDDFNCVDPTTAVSKDGNLMCYYTKGYHLKPTSNISKLRDAITDGASLENEDVSTMEWHTYFEITFLVYFFIALVAMRLFSMLRIKCLNVDLEEVEKVYKSKKVPTIEWESFNKAHMGCQHFVNMFKTNNDASQIINAMKVDNEKVFENLKKTYEVQEGIVRLITNTINILIIAGILIFTNYYFRASYEIFDPVNDLAQLGALITLAAGKYKSKAYPIRFFCAYNLIQLYSYIEHTSKIVVECSAAINFVTNIFVGFFRLLLILLIVPSFYYIIRNLKYCLRCFRSCDSSVKGKVEKSKNEQFIGKIKSTLGMNL